MARVGVNIRLLSQDRALRRQTFSKPTPDLPEHENRIQSGLESCCFVDYLVQTEDYTKQQKFTFPSSKS